jgi:PAS domain S-box-containing protein
MRSNQLHGRATAQRPEREAADAWLWHYLVERSPDAVAVLRGADHLLEYANQSFCELAGQPSERLLSCAFADAFRDLSRTPHSILDRVYATGQPEASLDHEHRIVGEGIRYVRYAAWPVPESPGRGRGVILTAKDVTDDVLARQELSRFARDVRALGEQLVAASVREREQAEEAARQKTEFDALLETLAEGILITDGRGRLLMMNAAARTVLGVRGNCIRDVADLERLDARRPDGSSLPADERPLARAMRGEVFSEYELLHVRPDGEARRVVACGTSVRNCAGHVSLATVVFRDVTDLHRLAQRREEYAALISHDLRGPLTSIVFSAQALKRSLERAHSPEDVRTIGRIVANADRMTSMIGELLEAASLEGRSCRPRFVPCDLAEVVAGVVERMDDALRRRIRVDAPERSYLVSGDPERLERAIANLVANALKYSPGETEVLVTLAKGDGELSVEVVDRGIGIAKADLPKLFERYYRAPTDKPVGGLGLGLYIARLITEAHRGRIAVESELGQGSSFRIVLPRPPDIE